MSEMSANLLQFGIIAVFFLLMIGFMFAESAWLSKQGWTSFGKAFVFSAVTNFLSFSVGMVIFMASFIILLAATWNGLQRQEVSDFTFIFVTLLGILGTPLLLLLCKRAFLAILKIQKGKSAWLYALISSLLTFFVGVGLPGLAGYLALR